MTTSDLQSELDRVSAKLRSARQMPNRTVTDTKREAWLWRRILRIEGRIERKATR